MQRARGTRLVPAHVFKRPGWTSTAVALDIFRVSLLAETRAGRETVGRGHGKISAGRACFVPDDILVRIGWADTTRRAVAGRCEARQTLTFTAPGAG